MNNARKARLKAKGWRTGSAGDFLGLSPEESYFVELKLRLADDLKLRRTKRRISQEQLAVLVGSSQSRIAKMERGDGPGMRPTIRAEELPMSSVTVEIPESLAALMKGLPIEQMTYEAIVLDLYRRATLSSG